MKKIKFFSGMFCCFILMLSSGLSVEAAPSDPVTIPDANLRAVIETKLSKTPGATITEGEMNGMTGQLFAQSKSIRSLTGLEHATRIGSLQLSRNNISDLSPLSGLTQLTSLDLDLNPMTDLSALSNLTNLTLLYAGRPLTQANYNGPTPADLSFLTKLTQLEYLKLNVWAIRDLSILGTLTALKELYLQYNHFSDISPLSSLTALTVLDLTFNYFLTDISPLGSLTALEVLHLTSNSRLSDISALKNLTNLRLLWLHATDITADGLAEVLPSFSSMENLILDGTRISDLSVLNRLPAGASMNNLSVRYIDDPPGATDDKGWLLKDLTPLVALLNNGKLVNQNIQSRIEVRLNWNLDYDSIYTDIPALIADFSMPGVVAYSPVVPGLRRVSEEHHEGSARSRHTFSVSAYSTFSDYRANWPGNRYTAEKVNEEFEGVPVMWKVTAPDGPVTENRVLTGDDGLSSFTFRLGNLDETYTVEAIVPENIREATEGPSHEELKVTFTATATTPPIRRTSDDWGGSGSGGSSGARTHIPFGTQSFIFNEVGNFWDDTNDWVELKNVCHTPLDLSEWQMRLITPNDVELGGQIKIDVISFPDFVLPAQAVLLVTNTDPNRTNLASGFNIATGARQKGAQHPYFVASDLKLPSTPFLLILQHTAPGAEELPPTLIDVAGNYFLEVLPDGTKVYSDAYTPDAIVPTAPLTDVGAWQRQRLEQPGYLAAAWIPSGYRGGIGYDRHVEVSVSLGTPGYRRAASPSLPAVYRLAFNEIRNASNDTDDWIELKNVCGEGVRLREWQISIVAHTGLPVDKEVNIVSFPDYTLPMGGVLLITNTDPSETVLAGGLNIATGARQKGAQHPYLVAPNLRLPETPYLLILQEVPKYGMKTIEDVAGNYALSALPDGTALYPHVNVSRLMSPLAPLARFGAWQRRHFEQPGYLALAWMSSGYHGGIGYDRSAPASVCLGTPGYRHDASPVFPVSHRLIFNKIHNAADTPDNWIDYIELKNLSATGVRLRDWEISIVASAGENADEDVGIVEFPDWTLPAGGLLLIFSTDPGPGIVDGCNIAMDAEETEAQQTAAEETEAERAYFVAPHLRLPTTPYLLILRHARGQNGTSEAIEDVAGDYFRGSRDTGVWPLTHTRHPSAPAAPLSEAGTWQRRDARQRGYLATAWTAIESPLSYAYDPDAFATSPVSHRLVFNKIRNAAHDTDDSIELKNISDTPVRLKDWTISSIASAGENADEDVTIVWFPDYTLPVGGVLLITNTEPEETVIVDGLNITPGATARRGAQHPYLVAPDLQLPETPYLLILRHARGQNGTPEAIEDMAGDYFQSINNAEDWHLAYVPHPSAPAAPLSETGTWQRKDVRQLGYLATAWTVSASPPGVSDTPNALEDDKHALFAPDAQVAAVFNPTLPDEVRISELMSETEGPSGALPEWIELYNASPTPVDLEGWQLVVETRIDTTHRHASLTLHPLEIPPKQTVLLVNGRVDRHSRVLPPNRVHDLSEVPLDAFRPRRLSHPFLSRDGFFLKLIHPTGRVVDTCGTLDGDPMTDDLPTWTLPDSKTPQGDRVSLLRRFDGDVLEGTQASGWMPATAVAIGVTHYYGHPRDISTPGFLHQIVPGVSPTVALSISELMFTTQTPNRDGLPQWIELYNPSLTGSVQLKDFQLVVETRHAGKPYQLVIDLEAMDVLPNQTVVLITERGRHSRHFTENRIYNLSQRHPKTFRSAERWQHLLSSDGFLIQLADATGNIVDTVGNLDGSRFTEDPPAWTWPPGETPEGVRASIRRLYAKRGFPLDGRHPEGWVSTATAPPAIMTYYGHASDVGNPTYRRGGPLPVVLSRFGAVRDEAAVVVSWTTESSLENAGFHLYRSAEREAGFVRVNPRLIQGAGTTSERQTYTYVDHPPKADGVYYYQIEEVSYSGEQQVLATARLKGYLTADGKHLTTLGALKTDE